jgi:hypothetical protein
MRLSVRERLVALDVGDPQLVCQRPGELPVHQVTRSGGLVFRSRAAAPGQALDLGAVHDHLDGAMPDPHAKAQGQLSMNPPGSIGTAGGQVNGLDLLGEPGVMPGAAIAQRFASLRRREALPIPSIG